MGFLVVFLILFYLVFHLILFLRNLDFQLSFIHRTKSLEILIVIVLLITEFIQIHLLNFFFPMY
jgi:hypothetical protein